MAAKLDLKVEPGKVGFRAPNDGHKGGIVRLKINNQNNEKIVFKIRLTNPNRFAVHPPYGFVEPSSSFLVKIKPKTFDVNDCPTNDHFSVLVAKAPPNVTEANLVWKKGGPYEPKETKRFVVNVVYCKGNAPLPPVIPEPIAVRNVPAKGAPAAAAALAAKKFAGPVAKKEQVSSGTSTEGSSEASESDEGSEEESEASDEQEE